MSRTQENRRTSNGACRARSSRVLHSLTLGVSISVAALGIAVVVQACGAGAQTSGRRVSFTTRVDLDASSVAGFQTATGWTVTLSKALLATGPFYYFDGAPPLVRLERTQRTRQLALEALGLGTVHAHPGHYQSGNALGQMLEPWSVDLLSGAAELPDGEGVTGVYRSARFSFVAAEAGPVGSELAGHAAIVEGRAEKSGELTRLFRAVADLPDVERSAARGEVEGCEFSELDIEADGRITVVVQPRVWFELVDFSQLEVGANLENIEFPPDSQPRIAFGQGLAQLSAYKFSYSIE